MKTIEEKAMAYDKAIERARKVHEYSSDLAEIKRMEHIFPELRESEEWIRNELISLVRLDGWHPMEWTQEKKNKMIDWLEKQGEQKPADKVESKFHEGEWITFTREDGTREVLQVSDIIDGRYYFNHLLQFSWSIKECDEKCHLWSIQDAKDGDVLADDYGIYIFDRFDEYDERCFLCMGAYQYSQKVFENRHMLCSIEVHPATKEQRDNLFAKMHEAGYTFDFETNELKKIEEPPVIDEGKAEMDHCFTKMMNGEKISSTWNKEDKERYISCLQRLGTGNPDQPETINSKWFKEHVTFLPQWKPSEEQLKFLQHYADQNNYNGTVLTSLLNDLKKL